MTTYAADTPVGRFGISTLVDSPDPYVASLPMAGLKNPVTGVRSVGPLAVLVDHVAGLVNHYRRAADEWTVSTELSMELGPDALAIIADAPEIAVVASARPVGAKGSTSIALCEITHGDNIIGMGTVRSAHIHRPGVRSEPPNEGASVAIRPTELLEVMGLCVAETDGAAPVLLQMSHPALNNSMGILHGGIASAGLELAASAGLNHDRTELPLETASLRVNFLRPFRGGGGSRYTADVLRLGSRSGVAEAHAVGSDGELALIGRLTAYR